MKTLNETTTDQVQLEIGILTSAGDSEGRFIQEGFDIINSCEDIECTGDKWTDIMHNSKGEVFAIYGEAGLTRYGEKVLFVQLDYEDCPAAFDCTKSHLVPSDEGEDVKLTDDLN